jgi:LysR family tcuABC transcriptional regulator
MVGKTGRGRKKTICTFVQFFLASTLEIRQLRYFIRVVELGSMGKAALDLGLVTSALSQQISRLESELAVRLLQRTANGTTATDAGLAFFRQAQLALRHMDEAGRAARQARLSGHVSIGLPPTTAAVLGLPLMRAMRERYPDVRLHLVETLSGHLATMLNMRQLDLAILFQDKMGRKWSVMPLLDEPLFAIAAKGFPGFPRRKEVKLAQLGALPLVLPTVSHGLRTSLAAVFARAKIEPNIVLEIDSLAMLMDAVCEGHAATIHPGAATARLAGKPLELAKIVDSQVFRRNVLASLSDEELSTAALGARLVLKDVVRELVQQGRWFGATLHKS